MMYKGSVDTLKLESNTTLHVIRAIVIAVDVGIATISSTCEQETMLIVAHTVL